MVLVNTQAHKGMHIWKINSLDKLSCKTIDNLVISKLAEHVIFLL